MDIRKLQRAIVDGLEDVKAQKIVVFNTEHLSPLFERVIVASGTSNRQTKALAASVRSAVKAQGLPVLRTEGEENGEWIIVDCGAAVAHIMQPAIRDYYHLEEIWGGKPVKMKLADETVRLVKASEDEQDAPVKKKAAAKKASAKTLAAASAAKSPARKTAAKTAAKSASAKSAPAKKAPVRKTPTKSAPVKTMVVGKSDDGNKKKAAPRGTVSRTVGVKKAAPKPVAKKAAPARKRSA
jgi:ribosome-associated protein